MTIDEFAKEITVTVDEVADWIEKELKIKPMIKANELRKGNVVNVCSTSNIGFCAEPGYVVVETIGHDVINAPSFCNYQYENLFGIELTPEILEKCTNLIKAASCLIKAGSCYYATTDYDFEICLVGDKYYFCYNDAEAISGRPIEFLHQLQNLYFCLTGEELNVEL